MNTTHEYTNEQIQAAIDAAFPAGARPEGFNLDNRPSSVDWKLEAPNRLAIARAFLAALPKPAEADPYARLKAYAAAGARIRCYYRDEGQVSFWGGWNVHGRWEWCQPVDQYEIHPDDLHLCPEYAPKPQAWTMPAPPPGRRWHREDWTQDMLPEGYRPLLDGEVIDKEDEFYYCGVGPWNSAVDSSVYASGKRVDDGAVYFRTRRPLPAEASAEPEQVKPTQEALLEEAMKHPGVAAAKGEGQAMTKNVPGDKCPACGAEEVESNTPNTTYACGSSDYDGRPDTFHPGDKCEAPPVVVNEPPQSEPAWIPHDGGPCPLKDCEVELWEFKLRHSGDKQLSAGRPPSEYYLQWEDQKGTHGITAYRVLKWKPGHGPQAVSKADEPATFEAHGKVWTRHMPGDPCPCDLRASVYVAFKDGTFSGRPGLAVNWAWGTYLPDSEWLIGWRYADEPAQAEAANTDKEWNEYQQELMNPLPKPWTPKPGDVVRLKSGGPEMTVEAPNKDSNTFCSWFDGNGINQRFFPAACLTPAQP